MSSVCQVTFKYIIDVITHCYVAKDTEDSVIYVARFSGNSEANALELPENL